MFEEKKPKSDMYNKLFKTVITLFAAFCILLVLSAVAFGWRGCFKPMFSVEETLKRFFEVVWNPWNLAPILLTLVVLFVEMVSFAKGMSTWEKMMMLIMGGMVVSVSFALVVTSWFTGGLVFSWIPSGTFLAAPNFYLWFGLFAYHWGIMIVLLVNVLGAFLEKKVDWKIVLAFATASLFPLSFQPALSSSIFQIGGLVGLIGAGLCSSIALTLFGVSRRRYRILFWWLVSLLIGLLYLIVGPALLLAAWRKYSRKFQPVKREQEPEVSEEDWEKISRGEDLEL